MRYTSWLWIGLQCSEPRRTYQISNCPHTNYPPELEMCVCRYFTWGIRVLHGSDDALGGHVRARTQGSPHVAILRGTRMGSTFRSWSSVVSRLHGRQQRQISSPRHRLQRIKWPDLDHQQKPVPWKSSSRQASPSYWCIFNLPSDELFAY